ncbi:unnamed protein product [Rhizoctonia solani]|uniref:Thioredoxin-like protein AAED1 n=1 Tax=Rhizoctonia solani TaxID=456999 RepID=A0A8H3DX52_9AGAM|nr:unnamed protein product [Rhizoctonia solani]
MSSDGEPTNPYLNDSSSSTTFHTSISSFSQLTSQTSLAHSIKARYPEPYTDDPFLPLKELRRLRSSEILTPIRVDAHISDDEDIANVDVSPTSSTFVRPYTSYFARTHSIDSLIEDPELASNKARKRPPPIQVGNQEPRSSPAEIAAEQDEENDVVGSPRSLKLSDASAFSLSLFPPTPTTPMNRQSWRRSADSSVRGPMAFSTPRHPYRTRATMEIDRPRSFKPTRASVDVHSTPYTSNSSDSFYSGRESDSAFETCAETLGRRSRDLLQSTEDVRVTRKPVPTIEPEPEPIEMSLVESVPSSSPPSTSTLSISKPKSKKKGRKLVISHPHMNDASGTTLPIGPKVTYSSSIGSLRDELLGGKGKKLKTKSFDRYALPTEDQLRTASDMLVYDQHAHPVRFGSIFQNQKTAICFIRHFWCPLCQDYISSIAHLTEPSLIHKAGVKLVIIGNGSPRMIESYKTVLGCAYEMYTDPGRKVYHALGMTVRTNDGGSRAEKGAYVKHGTFTGTMMVLGRALKMPLANAGDIKQLGGEFVLGPGLTCSFASRMHTTRSHTPIRDLLRAAGVSTNPEATELSFLGSDSKRWTDALNEDMDSLIRRGLRTSCGDQCSLDEVGHKLDLGEFRRLIERMKDQDSEPATTYLVEVMGQSRTRLDQLEAVTETRGQ